MFTKSLIALSAALIVVTMMASAASAQSRGQAAQVLPFTPAEQVWFDTAEGHDRLPR